MQQWLSTDLVDNHQISRANKNLTRKITPFSPLCPIIMHRSKDSAFRQLRDLINSYRTGVFINLRFLPLFFSPRNGMVVAMLIPWALLAEPNEKPAQPLHYQSEPRL
jgi:hypothetical protein